MAWPRFLRFRYTLRALLVFITLFAIWGGYHANRGWKERRAVEALLQHGATVDYWPVEWNSSLGGAVAFGYRKLVGWLWGDCLVQRVTLTTSLEPDVVDALASLRNLKSIALHAPEATETSAGSDTSADPPALIAVPANAIERMLDNHKLDSLTITDTALTDAAFDAISRQTSLEGLVFERTNLSAEHLAKLIVLPRLRDFTFISCRATSAELDSLPGSPTLRRIWCHDSPIGVELAAFVARSPNVEELIATLPYRANGNDFVEALGPHPSLADLWLGLGKITDHSIPTLERMPRLKHLQSVDEISVGGRARLAKTRPDLEL